MIDAQTLEHESKAIDKTVDPGRAQRLAERLRRLPDTAEYPTSTRKRR
jgi:hypothetical protein